MTELNLSKLARITQHLLPNDDLTLITLKGHLLVEDLLGEIIASYCKSPDALDGDLGFAVKLKFAKALTGSMELALVWSACQKLNSLRNALAHKLEHPDLQKRLVSFITIFNDSVPEWRSTGEQTTDIKHAIIFLLGALQEIEKPLQLKDT